MKVPNELNKTLTRRPSVTQGVTIPSFFASLFLLYLGKNATPRLRMRGQTGCLGVISSFGDSLEFAFFGASASAGALFNFTEKLIFQGERK